MTLEEAISAIETAKGECEWNAPLDYQIAFDMAIEALKKQIPRKYVFKDGYFVCANCKKTVATDYYYCPNCGQAHDWSDDDEDEQLYSKIYFNNEPNEIAEKIYNLCGDREKLIDVWKEIGEYIESESEQAISALEPCVKYVDRDKLISAICEKYCEYERNGELYFDACRIKQDLANLIVDFPSVMLKTESEETNNE